MLEKMSKVFQPRSRSAGRSVKKRIVLGMQENSRPAIRRKVIELAGRQMTVELEEKSNEFVLKVFDKGRRHELVLSPEEVYEFVGKKVDNIFSKITIDKGEIVLNY